MEMYSTLEEYRKVYEMLADEESRDIYLNKLNWLISGNQKYIDAIVAKYLPGVPLLKKAGVAELKKSMPQDREVVLYGAGSIGKILLRYWQDDDRFVGFCSQTKEKQKKGYCGWPVISPEQLLAQKDMSVLISTTRSNKEIRQILKEGGYPQDQIYSWAEYDYEDPGQYFAPDFMVYGDEEVFIDAGCCDLNSTLQLRKYCKHLKKVYALEPDPESYAVCQEKKARFHVDEAELFPVGAWSERTTLHFKATNDGVSHVCDDGEIVVPVATIDEIVEKENPKVTMIKMDIEGSELEALKGAKKTIQRNKPKLAICIYHKPEDMLEIPLYIKSLVPEYKLYVRHHSNSNVETILYAVRP